MNDVAFGLFRVQKKARILYDMLSFKDTFLQNLQSINFSKNSTSCSL